MKKISPRKLARLAAILAMPLLSLNTAADESTCPFLSNPHHALDGFFDKLQQLRTEKNNVVHIVHLGDSHVQAGFLSGYVMRQLHQHFGNAGRGWVSPLKIAGLNEPNDYRFSANTTSSSAWTVSKCTRQQPVTSWGAGGIGVRSGDENMTMLLSVTPNNGAGYQFNQVRIYHDHGVDTILLQAPADSVYFLHQPNTTLYGATLSNGQHGIQYHALGVNGAKFKHFCQVHFFQQLQLLQPDLLIVSLGSNEASNDYKVNVETFRSCVDSFVAIARVMLPNTPIILSTPAETYIRIRKKFDVNPNIHLVANTITHYAQANNIPCFDLFEATGGVNSSVNALDNNLLRKDRVHFNEQGYQQHASLLVNSILCLLDSYSSEKIF